VPASSLFYFQWEKWKDSERLEINNQNCVGEVKWGILFALFQQIFYD